MLRLDTRGLGRIRSDSTVYITLLAERAGLETLVPVLLIDLLVLLRQHAFPRRHDLVPLRFRLEVLLAVGQLFSLASVGLASHDRIGEDRRFSEEQDAAFVVLGEFVADCSGY